MNSDINRVTILRKRVVTNIPMFDDPETGNPQNEWVKLYDLDCVDIAPGMTARVYNLEHDENYSNQDTNYYVEFHFTSGFQHIKPPYDIHEGDYVGCRQAGQVCYYRIVRTITTQIFANCCDYQLICNVTNPREAERLMGCGPLKALKRSDYVSDQRPTVPTPESPSTPEESEMGDGGDEELVETSAGIQLGDDND